MFPQQLDTFIISLGIIFSVHPAQGSVTARLHGQVEVVAQIGQGRPPAAKVLRDGAGLQGPQPHPAAGGGGAHRLNEIHQLRLVRQVPAPGGDLDAGEHQLLVALLCQLGGLSGGLSRGQGADGASGVGDDAVGAEIDTAVLHLEHGPGAALQPPGGQPLEGTAAESVVHLHHLAPVGAQRLQPVQKPHAVVGTHHQIHLQGLHRLRVGLGIAAAHRHDGVGRAFSGLPDHLAGFFVAHRRDGTGVDDVGVGLPVKGYQGMAPAGQLGLHGLGLVLVDLAAQSIDRCAHTGSSPAGDFG